MPDRPLPATALPARPEAGHDSIPTRFRQQVLARPNADAIRDHGRSITYAELGARMDSLRDALLRRGLQDGEVVGICLSQGIELLVAQLAVLDAGGICLPIDPAAPDAHQRHLLASTQARFWIAPHHRSPPTDAVGFHVAPDIQESNAHAQALPTPPVSPRPAPSAVGFILFTSGSTGTPKGVCIRQSSVIHLVCDTDYVQVTPKDVVMLASHVAFDAILFEAWAPLLNGGCIQVVSKDECLQPALLGQRLRDTSGSVAVLTTSLFNLVASIDPAAFGGLRTLLVGGEVLSPECSRRVLASAAPPRLLLNVYGPTEATTFSTFHPVTLHDLDRLHGQAFPIGRPIRRATVVVASPSGQELAHGEVGEIRIGGDGIADGYWRQPGLTSERFVPDPHAPSPGRRAYLTGDLGRVNEEGALEFHGRRDDQVKLRGQRIELGEVESILRRHPWIEDVAVIAEVDQGRTRQLMAFVTWRPDAIPPGTEPCTAKLLAWMRAEAAPHLVPARAFAIERLPRTPSGKIDRRALAEVARSPAPGVTAPLGAKPASAEDLAVQLWRQLLGRDDIQPDSDFFELGGDSLLAVTMLSDFARASGCNVPIGAWLPSPTPRTLAGHARGPRGRQGLRFFLVEWLLRWDASDLAGVPCHVLPFPRGAASPEEACVPHLAQGCLGALASHDDHEDAPFILVGYSMAGFVVLEMARRLASAGRAPLDVWLVDSVLPTPLHKASHRIVAWAGRLLGLPFDRQLALARIGHSIAEVAVPLTQARLGEAVHRLGDEWRRTVSFVRQNVGHPTSHAPARPARGTGTSHPSHHLHVWANHAYQPKPYVGPVACFLTRPTQEDQPGPKNGWGPVLPHVDIIEIPGNHASCIRADRASLLDAFRARLATTTGSRGAT